MDYEPSKKAIWLAANSGDAPRLDAIMQEHTSLLDLPPHWSPEYPAAVKAAKHRIQQLRAERDAIIAQYEEKALDGVGAVQS
ncbi:hypothetical protein ACTHPH_23900 [Paenibacillus pasadenensis]|uniref:hypothetical protein n=1 Tax=Paenibacillus pasadenensis TaxID=217090 RepID=UPI00048ED711|nr:hypothetical protein [Paenibacillus pasadenensis]